ncbi:hypothetical protein LY76DRAFT_54193 [Colletotrichum caudatum]|nr:hypothetical protein LY76DRAFT_54193 [Colletotrichum caudatum]
MQQCSDATCNALLCFHLGIPYGVPYMACSVQCILPILPLHYLPSPPPLTCMGMWETQPDGGVQLHTRTACLPVFIPRQPTVCMPHNRATVSRRLPVHAKASFRLLFRCLLVWLAR